jgi:multicomponent K+:H+ antiporter subunit E
MNRLIVFPVATVSLLGLWLLLNQTLSPGHFLLGGAVAIVGGWTLAALELPNAHLRRFGMFFRLAALVLMDIVRSNVAVAGIILGIHRRHGAPGFVEIPLELRNTYGLAILACIITSTPGTLWVGFDERTGILTIHVLDLVHKSEWVRTIKERYERQLLEIFG